MSAIDPNQTFERQAIKVNDVARHYWPEEMEPQSFYEPVERGFRRENTRAPSPGGTSSASVEQAGFSFL